MRKLLEEEIKVLERNHCEAEDWSLIKVADTFSPDSCYAVRFAGECSIGDLSGVRYNEFGVPLRNGIRSAYLSNCNIGNHTCIQDIHNFISNYDIGDNCTIINVNKIAMKGESTFGVGTEVSVMNETGGMDVPLSRYMSASIAYMLTIMGQDEDLRRKIYELVAKEVEDVRSSRGVIANNVTIQNTDTIINTWIGEYAEIKSATLLENCTLCSDKDAPIKVGYSVQGREFIASEGTSLMGGSIVERCFIGQASVLDHLYSAHDSLFFANCHLENGEACAVFAGPFTVSNHKSSLLIAGHFSFLNAGSGSNQSNHLYKLGPIHRGVVERGSKTSSDSYVLWPSRIGAFNLVMGRHVDNVDTTDFPFSYMIENDNKTFIVPGRNLLSIGTMRDAKKWPARDKRSERNKLDCVNYNLLSPFTVGKMEVAYGKLKDLYDYLGGHDHVYTYKNLFFKPTSLKKGLQTYSWGIEKFIGNSLITRIFNSFGLEEIPSIEALRSALIPDHEIGNTEWIDMSGMIAPSSLVTDIIDDIKGGKLDSIVKVNGAIRDLHERYYDLEWDWCYHLMCRWYDIDNADEISIEMIMRILDDWHKAVRAIDKALYEDARKEFHIIGRVNLGITLDSTEESDDAHKYAEMVLEGFEENDIVQSVKDHVEKKENLYDRVITQLKPIL